MDPSIGRVSWRTDALADIGCFLGVSFKERDATSKDSSVCSSEYSRARFCFQGLFYIPVFSISVLFVLPLRETAEEAVERVQDPEGMEAPRK